MAGLPPGDPKLVSMIVNHLKSQGLFDQFRRDCLADVDTKPAYLNLRQRVDNFVSNHLSNHTWSPHLNKNQLRNNIRQLVLQSGMLEAGVDRIITQVVDPKIHHKFKPQVERVVHDYLTSINQKESDQIVSSAQIEEKQDYFIATPGTSSGPSTTVASDAMSILDTITSLNQEASAAWASTESIAGKSVDRTARRGSSQIADGGLEKEKYLEESMGKEKADLDEAVEESCAVEEETPENALQASEDALHTVQEISDPIEPSKETAEESEDPENMSDKREEGKEKNVSKTKEEAAEAAPTEKEGEEQKAPSEKHIIKQKARERLKEEYSLEDSDLEGLSDISVSSVHTSDLSSFDEESEEEPPLSDSTEEGEITSEDEEYQETKTNSTAREENEDRKPRAGRQAYVHKPFLYSKYYSDSDDEVTVEQRRRSIAKDKEERLLKRQQNREKLEERRKHKAAEKGKPQETLHSVEQDKVQRKTGTVSPSSDSQGASVKEALKEQKVLEKKVAISRRRKRNSRKDGDDGTSQKRKREPEDEFKELLKKAETSETYAKDPKPPSSKSQLLKPVRRLSESVQSAEESKHEHRRKRSGSTVSTSPQADETAAEVGELKEPKKLLEKVKVHSFLSDLDPSYDETYKPRATGKIEKHLKKETISDAETESGKKKEVKHPKEKSEKERSMLDDKVKHKSKSDKAQKTGDAAEHHASEGKGMENLQKDSGHQVKASSDEKSDRKSKVKNDRKCLTSVKDVRLVISEVTSEDVLHKDGTRKVKISLADQPKAEQKVKGDRSLVRSDTKVQLGAGCSSKENPVSQNKVESSSEDRSDMELGSESGRKKEKLLKDIKKRSKSYSDDRHVEKIRSRTENKEAKASDKEGLGPESKSKVDQSSKESHHTEKSHLGADVDRKSKDSDSCLEVKAATESESESTGRSSSQRDSSHKLKAEKPASKSAKGTSSSKTEKKSQGTEHKSKSAKPSHRLEALKERKKEGGIKEEKKAPVEKPQSKTKEDTQEMLENEQESKEVKKAVDKKFSIKEIESDKRKGSTSVSQVSGSLTDVSEQEGSTTEGSSTSPQDIEVIDNLNRSVQENVPVSLTAFAASETTEPEEGASVCRSESDHTGLEGKGSPTEIVSKTVLAKDNSMESEAVDTVSYKIAASNLTPELEVKTPVAAVPVVRGTGSGQELKEAEAESSKQDTPASQDAESLTNNQEIVVELGDPAPVHEDETNKEASKTKEEADFLVKNVELEEESTTPVEIKYNQEGKVDCVDQQEAATEGVCKEERKEVQRADEVSVHEELPIINLPSGDSLTNIKQRTEQPAPISIQEHEEPDLKTKEAALALLSMDPQIPVQVEEETQTQLLAEAIPRESSLVEADVGGFSSTQKSDVIPENECLGAAEHKESALLVREPEEKKEDTEEMIKEGPSLGNDESEVPPEKDTAKKDEATNESESKKKDKGMPGTTSQDKQEAEIKDTSKEGKTPRRGRLPKTSASRVKDTADGQVSGHPVENKKGENKDFPLIPPHEGNTDIPLDEDKADYSESSEPNPATETGKTCSKLEATEETEMLSAETLLEENKSEGVGKETSLENEPKRTQRQQLQTTGDEGQQYLGQELEMKEECKESEIKSDNGKAEMTDKKRRGRGRPKRVSVSSEPMLAKEEEAENKVVSAEKLEEGKESKQPKTEKQTAAAEMPTEEPPLVKGAGEPSVSKDEIGDAEDQISDNEDERKSARRGRPSGKCASKLKKLVV
ncbi:biorientation of chromosomes in cell division protein 1-like 1 isoform X2 [Polyodon spathula]|uniref:biorientation of chromosomes in cell division protein 1-like 1 isoform X2 n=1 Tax=Polyodon spathula TaxID=7913 RepID=UPI001B7E69E2|nr:biorientation of chromosomes in cell division protein 1-like 1 isoform X2 [Polyodon spathula]